MSFLKKLKIGLFKSSNKIDEGLEKIKHENILSEEIGNHAEETNKISKTYSSDFDNKNIIDEKEESTTKKFLKRFIIKDKKNKNDFKINRSLLEQLEETLITSDMGVETSNKIIRSLSRKVLGKKMNTYDLKLFLAEEILKIFQSVENKLEINDQKLNVILVVGVNGSGKTTTIGKLANLFKNDNKKVLIAAGDTFRAAAVEQLEIWGKKTNTEVFKLNQGTDPASLCYDAISKAEKEDVDILMIDTAGRLQNRNDLMEELSKVVRVIKKKNLESPLKTILVLDATTGQNALSQVEMFKNMADVSGLVMTKLDGSAKGGILVPLTDKFSLPIHAVGVGEKIDDLNSFNVKEYVEALLNLKEGS